MPTWLLYALLTLTITIVGTALGTLLVPPLRRYGHSFIAWASSLTRRVRTLPERRRHRRASEARARLVREVTERARANGIGLIVRVHSASWEYDVATNTLGQDIAYFHDLRTYRRALESGAVDPTKAYCKRPPMPVSSWTEEQLQRWLNRNPPAT